MSGRVRVTLADGRRVTGFRKTLARREYVPPHERPDTRILLRELPPAIAMVSPGPTGITGVAVQPGPMVVAAGKIVEWVYGQMAAWLSRAVNAARIDELVLRGVVECGDVRREQSVSIMPDTIEFPRGARKALRFKR